MTPNQDHAIAVESGALPFSAEEASKHRIIFYKLPQDVEERDIDPLLWPVVRTINASGWVWTAESCQGHPDYARPGDAGWDHNVRPFLRLVVSADRLGEMMGALTRAMRLPNILDGLEDDRIDVTCSFETFVWPRPLGPWEQVNIYVNAHNVLGRNRGIEALSQFARAL